MIFGLVTVSKLSQGRCIGKCPSDKCKALMRAWIEWKLRLLVVKAEGCLCL